MENWIKFIQRNKEMVITVKTVDWLVENTRVDVFSPEDFTGYQRKIDEAHCESIIESIEKDGFYLPSAIICSKREGLTNDDKLFVVDGQHRIAAFRKMKKTYPYRYSEIMDYELPVIILMFPNILTEIQTFIDINKKAKKVDTSLAYILRNKLNDKNDSKSLDISRKVYVAVEIATRVSNDEESAWYNSILFEGSIKKSLQIISLNAFARALCPLFACFERHGIIKYSWKSEEELDKKIVDTIGLLDTIWTSVKTRWPELFDAPYFSNKTIQGPIGLNAINKLLIFSLDNYFGDNAKNLKISRAEAVAEMKRVIADNKTDSKKWQVGGDFSKYSSESGYAQVALSLIEDTTFPNKLI